MRIAVYLDENYPELTQIKIPLLNCITSCDKGEDPKAVAVEWVKAMMWARYRKSVYVFTESASLDRFMLRCKDTKYLLALILLQQREKANVSQRELAKKIGRKSHSAIKLYEAARSEPSFSIFLELLDALGVEIDLDLKGASHEPHSLQRVS